MRSLFPDSRYFTFLDALKAQDEANFALAPLLLVQEFPVLRSEEAKAICADWRMNWNRKPLDCPLTS